MEPVTIVVLSAIAVTGIVALSAFIHQLFLSRNQKINEKAQKSALKREAKELANIRKEMQESSTPQLHYQLLGENKEAIRYIDNRIDELMQRKAEIIERYSQTVANKADLISNNKMTNHDMKSCQQLKCVVDSQIKQIDSQIMQLRETRKQLWNDRSDLHDKVIEKEERRQQSLDKIYHSHSGTLEKIYAKHIESRQKSNSQTIKSSNLSFKQIVMAPIKFLQSVFFPPTTAMDALQVQRETAQRQRVDDIQNSFFSPQKIFNTVASLFR